MGSSEMSEQCEVAPITLLSKQLGSACMFLISSYVILLTITWVTSNSPNSICKAPDFSAWTATCTAVLFGATFGAAVTQIVKVAVGMQRHASWSFHAAKIALAVMMFISSTSHFLIYRQHNFGKHYVCEDGFGVRTPIFQWSEWLVTVPFMFYLNIAFDDTKNSLTGKDISILILATTCLLANFSTTWGFSLQYQYLSVMYSVISMGTALWLNFYQARTNFLSVTNDSSPFKMELCIRHYTASKYLVCIFPCFPVVYFLRVSNLIDNDIAFICTTALNYLAKALYTIFVLDEHTEVLDPSSLKLFQERAANKARRSFLRYVFHEVRVPLNSISMGLHLLHDEANNAPEKNQSTLETIEMMKEATLFMGETLNDVLSIQKIEEGKLELNYEPFIIANSLRSVTLSLKGQIDSKKINLLVSIDDNVPIEVKGDRFRIEHVLANLLSNAIKFSSTGADIAIHVSFQDKSNNNNDSDNNVNNNQMTTFTVRDHGIGISEEDQANLFKTYMQINPSSTQSGRGTGVGLAICKEIIRLHGGQISCVSKLRQGNDILSGGSEFSFSVPFEIITPASSTNNSDNNSGNIVSKEVNDDNNINNSSDSNINSLSNSSSDGSKLDAPTSLSSVPPAITTSSDNTSGDGHDTHTNTDSSNSSSLPSSSSSSSSSSSCKDLDSRNPSSPSSPSRTSDGASATTSSNPNTNTNQTPSPSSKLSVYRFNVLIVDDVASNRKILRSILEKKGLVCDMAESGQECLDAVSEKGIDYYDIIFMDNLMPKMNGTVAAKHLRERGFRHIIAGLTGNAMDEDMQEFCAFGADLVFPKPLRIAQLDSFLHDCQVHGTMSSEFFAQEDKRRR